MAQLNDLLVMGLSTLLGPVNINSHFLFNTSFSEKGNKTGVVTSLFISGPTYDPVTSGAHSYIDPNAKYGKMTFGDPGPQIIFLGSNTEQKIALAFHEYDNMTPNYNIEKRSTTSSVSSTSLHLVSNSGKAAFITDYAKIEQFLNPIHTVHSAHGEGADNADGVTAGSLQYGLHMHNSNIAGVNGIYFADGSNTWHEGLNFPRDDKTDSKDTFRLHNGKMYFVTDRSISDPDNRAGTNYEVYHKGNLTFSLSGTNNTTLTITTS